MNRKPIKKMQFRLNKYSCLKKFAKAWALLIIYHNPNREDTREGFEEYMFEFASKELLKMKLPDGWNQHASYSAFEHWFLNNVHK
jgi:ABC-type sugar transport system substrate-binding protein